ncbi:hypothetical protein HBI08_238930 [Parastagonospora nodorum]|nr:hypothetical protein HBI08_238930 [Parastagonospora nodorum]
MSQTNVREGYRIITLEVIKLIEDLISYLAVAKYIQLQNAQILKVFYKAAYSAKVKIEDLSNMLTLTLSKTAQRQSSSVMSNKSIALITNKFGVALLTKLAILNNANITLVDAMHYSIQKLEKNYFKVRAQHLKYNVIDALIMTLIKNNNDLLGTVNSYIKLRRLRATDLLLSALGKEAQLKKTRDKEKLAKAKKEKEKKEAQERKTYLDINSKDNLEDEEATTAKNLAREQKKRLKALLNAKTRDSLSLINAYILYFKELLSNNSRIFANAIGIGKTRAIVLAVLIEHFCFFSNSPLENIGRLTKEKAIEMQINTTNAISKALTTANKLVALQSYVLEGFIIVCSFRKVDKHMFRAYNTISVTAQRMIIRKGGSYIEKRAILLSSYFNATNKRDSVTSDCIYKIEDARNIIANIKHDASKHESSYNCLYLDFLSIVQNAKQQCRDILEKESLNKLEASRRVIFNCFKMQAIASYSALATLKAAQFKTYSSCKVKRFTLNSVKDLFTNLSKDYFLVREARAITKSSLNIAAEDAAKAANILPLLKEVRAKILIKSYKLIMQAIIVALIAFAEAIILTEATHVVIIEPQDSIIYFNLDSELKLKVLDKQDVKTTF